MDCRTSKQRSIGSYFQGLKTKDRPRLFDILCVLSDFHYDVDARGSTIRSGHTSYGDIDLLVRNVDPSTFSKLTRELKRLRSVRPIEAHKEDKPADLLSNGDDEGVITDRFRFSYRGTIFDICQINYPAIAIMGGLRHVNLHSNEKAREAAYDFWRSQPEPVFAIAGYT